MSEIGPNIKANTAKRRRLKRMRDDGKALRAMLEDGKLPVAQLNKHLTRLLREERRRSWAVGEDLQRMREVNHAQH